MGSKLTPAQMARNRLAGTTSKGTPEQAAKAAADLAEITLANHIRKAVDRAPALSAEQRQRLALLLTGPGEDPAPAAPATAATAGRTVGTAATAAGTADERGR